jgi:hypothetical protein
MGKTKPQAQKRIERQAKIEEAEEKQRQEKISRALAHQNSQKQVVHTQAEPTILSRKALRKQKKEEKSEEMKSGKPSFLELEVNKSIVHSSTEHTIKKLMNATQEKALEVSEKEKQKFSTEPQSARIVQNHSTYCEGLKPVLARLAKNLPACTIIPGELSQNKSGAYPHLAIHFQRMVDENNYKFVVRRGHTAQELTISVPNVETYSQVFLEECIEEAIQKTKKQQDSEGIEDSEEISISNYNRLVAENRESLWKKKHQEQHEVLKEQEKIIKRKKKVKEQSRALANKNIPIAERKQYAERDVDILSGKVRGKYSMN